jgi:hypothetical protein
VVQNGTHSGTLRAMSEPVTYSNASKSASQATDSRQQSNSDKQEADLQSEPEKMEKREIGGPQGPEPTRYGDWERKGRCIDF